MLSFGYQVGHVSSHSTSSSIGAEIDEEVDVDFGVAQSKTTFKFTTSMSWSQSTEDSVVTTVTSGVTVPVTVPTGKVYETDLIYTQEELDVPYTLNTTVTGVSETWFESRVQGHYNWGEDIGDIFVTIAEKGLAGDDSPKFSKDPTTGAGLFTLSGLAKLYGGGNYTIKTYDVTPKTDDVTLGAAAPGPDDTNPDGVGVKVRLGDAGGEFRDTRYDDFAIGGAGDDSFVLHSGSDIVLAGGGDDSIGGFGEGSHVLHGEQGDDSISAVGSGRFNLLDGGPGDDVLLTDAPSSVLLGGEGDDRFLVGPGGQGTLIRDGEGANELAIDLGARLAFERVGQALIIHRGEGGDYDPQQDVVWVDFFADADSRVNGRTGEELLALGRTPEPLDSSSFEELAVLANQTYAETGAWEI